MAGRWRMASVQMTFAIMPALIYWFAGQSIASGHAAISIGTVVAFSTLQTRLLFPLQSLLEREHRRADLDSRCSRGSSSTSTSPWTSPSAPTRSTPAPSPARCASRTSRSRYDDGERSTLRDIDLVVPAGTSTAIVGETGSGKTTLGYLVARLYDAGGGRVTHRRHRRARPLLRVAGADRRRGVAGDLPVPRERSATTSASPRPDATDEEIEAAARAAQIHDLIAALPDGYDTIVGERGYRFSRRREAAHRDRADTAAQPADPRARRGHERARQRRPSAPSRRRSTG